MKSSSSKMGDMTQVDHQLNTAEKLAVLKKRANELNMRVGSATGDELPPADSILITEAKKLVGLPTTWIIDELRRMPEHKLKEIKASMDANTGKGKKAVEWMCQYDTIAMWVDAVKTKYNAYKQIEEGLDAVLAAWKVRMTSCCMTEDGAIQLDGLRAVFSERLPAGRQSKITKARVVEIRAVIKMQGVLDESEIKKMVAKLAITKEEYDEVVNMADEDVVMDD